MDTPKEILKEDVKKGKPAVERSPQWSAVRNRHLKLHPMCEACGSIDHIQVHHIKPFHLFPELELEPTNLISICEKIVADDDKTNDNHHLQLGHNGDFHNNNKNFRLLHYFYLEIFHFLHLEYILLLHFSSSVRHLHIV